MGLKINLFSLFQLDAGVKINLFSLFQLDAGVPETVMLSSRDESSVFIVSYAELKRQFSTAFHELATAGQPVGFS